VRLFPPRLLGLEVATFDCFFGVPLSDCGFNGTLGDRLLSPPRLPEFEAEPSDCLFGIFGCPCPLGDRLLEFRPSGCRFGMFLPEDVFVFSRIGSSTEDGFKGGGSGGGVGILLLRFDIRLILI